MAVILVTSDRQFSKPRASAAAATPARGQWTAGIGAILAFVALTYLFRVAIARPDTVLTLGAILLGAVAIIRRPITGIYITIVTTIVTDTYASPYVQTVLSEMGFFRNLNLLGFPKSVTITMFEVVLIVTLLRVLIGRFGQGLPLVRGPLWAPMLVVGAMVALGEVNGILTGGDFKVTMWEIRPLIYLIALYILTVKTVTRPRHVRAILWLTVICTAIRALDGIWRYTQILPALQSRVETVLEHDDSLFFAAVIGLLVAAILWRRYLPRRFYWAVLAVVPPVVIMMELNKRRAVFLCVALIILALIPVLWSQLRGKETRRRFTTWLIIVGMLGGAYVAAFWNQSGALAAPAHAIKSYFQPDERDFLSNLYRTQENTNLRVTLSHSPIIGIGFGKKMDIVVPMVDLTAGWALQLYMPHNNMLWLWERMGIIGFGAFWALVGSSILLAVASVRHGLAGLGRVIAPPSAGPSAQRVRGPQGRPTARLKGTAQDWAEFLVLALLLLSLLATLMALGSADQGFMSIRLMAYTGVIAGALAGAWETYARCDPPLLTTTVPQLTTQETLAYVHRRRMRIVSGS